MLAQFNSQVEEAIAQQRIIPIESRQLLMNIMSMCIYPFVAKPIIKTMMQMDENSFGELMEKRKNDVYEFIIKAITP